ncbi:hypothetical protein [Parabacteroides sp. ASF519]|uniref:hypothetical protein n=1 Tax=Parabacteroides sp. ASF519 TaxID=1235803 RepID=UPI00202CC510|nr:hypothetical protein [Parabacteroides sp. ASF519]
MNAELQPDQPAKFPTNDAVIREMLGDNYKSLNGKTVIPFDQERSSTFRKLLIRQNRL